MTITLHIVCPHCEEDVRAEGDVISGERYCIGEFAPPGSVFEDGPECDLITPPCCPHCGYDLYCIAVAAILHHAERR